MSSNSKTGAQNSGADDALWQSPLGEVICHRFPFRGEKSHRAWDSADRLFLELFSGHRPDYFVGQAGKGNISSPGPGQTTHESEVRWAFIGEHFSAIAAAVQTGRTGSALHKAPGGPSQHVLIVSDSFLAHQAAQYNLGANAVPPQSFTCLYPAELKGLHQHRQNFTNIVLRIPRSIELLGSYLSAAALLAAPGARLYLGGRSDSWTPSVAKLVESQLELRARGRFVSRARWDLYAFAADPLPAQSVASQSVASQPVASQIDESFSDGSRFEYNSALYQQRPGVFSSDHLDPGAAFFLGALPEILAMLPQNARVGDLGCGNGILGIEAARQRPDISLSFADESHAAIESCRFNYRQLIGEIDDTGAEFILGNGFESVADAQFDVVFCNPPFHFANIQTPDIAMSMFEQAKSCLKKTAPLFVVGNAHLGYHVHLKRFFSQVHILKRDKRFIILQAHN